MIQCLDGSELIAPHGVGVECKRAQASAQAAVVAALVELPDGTGQSWGENSTILAMRSARVRGT